MMVRALVCAAMLVLSAVAPLHASAASLSPITLDVHDADLTDVFALLAAQSGTNIVADASVKPQKVTIHLHNVSFDEALGVIVASHNLQVRKQGAILIVGAADAMNRRYDGSNAQHGSQTAVLSLQRGRADEVAREITDALPSGTVVVADKRTSSIVVTGDDDVVARARRLVAALDGAAAGTASGAVTKTYRLRYLKVDDVIKQLKSIAPDGSYVAAAEQNALLVTGGQDVQTATESVIASIDRASPQVLFEVRVADVTPENESSNFGLEFGGLDLSGQPISGGTTYAFTKGRIPVNVRLNALITQGRAQILATPKLVTINNKEADLLIGQTYPIVYNTSVLGGQNVQFVDVGVKLRLTPTIGSDGIVTAEMHPEYSEILGLTGSGYPIIANRKIDSTLRVGSDETIVLGGLMRDVTNETIQRVPGLSDIPILGNFFKNKQKNHERDEIVFLITPHVIYPDQSPPAR